MRRRRLLQATGTLLAGGLAGCGSLTEPEGIPRDGGVGRETDTSWVRPGFDDENTRYNPGGVVPDSPSEAWTTSVPFSLPDPVVKDDVVYVTVADELVALDARDGNERWRRPANTPPVVEGKAVAVGHGSELVLYARSDGSDYDRFAAQAPIRGPPVPMDDGAFVVTNGERVSLVGDPQTDGWQRRLFGEVEAGVSALGDHTVAAATRAGEVYIVSGSGTGRDRWTTESPAASRPTLGVELPGAIVRTMFGGLHGLRPDHANTWQFEGVSSDVALADDHVYAPAGDEVVVLDAGSGEEAFRTSVDGTAKRLAIAGDALLVPTKTGTVHVLDRFDGTELHALDVGATATCVVPGARRLFVHCVRNDAPTLAVYE